MSSGGANTDNSATHQPNGRLIDGQFNEDESHATFLEAVNAWRDTGNNHNASMKS